MMLQVVLSALSSAIGIFLLAVLVQVAEVVMSDNRVPETQKRDMSPVMGGLVSQWPQVLSIQPCRNDAISGQATSSAGPDQWWQKQREGLARLLLGRPSTGSGCQPRLIKY